MGRYVRETDEPEVYEEHVHQVSPERGPSWTSFALVKYGFMLIMTVVILYFIAVYVLPMVR